MIFFIAAFIIVGMCLYLFYLVRKPQYRAAHIQWVSSLKITEFEAQIGGHSTACSRLYLDENKHILKPFQTKGRGIVEENFYRHIQQHLQITKEEQQIYRKLSEFVPKYYGTIGIVGEEKCYIRLENLVSKFRCPNILDLKLGTKTYKNSASESKRQYELQKYPLQQQIGFRLDAMQIYEPTAKVPRKYDKHYGRKLTEEGLKDAFLLFFQLSGNPIPGRHVQKQYVEQCLHKLNDIIRWFEHQTKYTFIATSLLILYEAGMQEKNYDCAIDLRLIDFGNVSHGSERAPEEQGQRDEGVLTGLYSLRDYLQGIIMQLNI